MARSTRSAVVILILFGVTRSVAANPTAPFPHIRSSQPELLEAIDDGARVSQTFRRPLDRLDASDLVVYVGYRSRLGAHLAGQTTFLTATAGVRYLRISIDPAVPGFQRIALLGHELQHAVEIAGAPEV